MAPIPSNENDTNTPTGTGNDAAATFSEPVTTQRPLSMARGSNGSIPSVDPKTLVVPPVPMRRSVKRNTSSGGSQSLTTPTGQTTPTNPSLSPKPMKRTRSLIKPVEGEAPHQINKGATLPVQRSAQVGVVKEEVGGAINENKSQSPSIEEGVPPPLSSSRSGSLLPASGEANRYMNIGPRGTQTLPNRVSVDSKGDLSPPPPPPRRSSSIKAQTRNSLSSIRPQEPIKEETIDPPTGGPVTDRPVTDGPQLPPKTVPLSQYPPSLQPQVESWDVLLKGEISNKPEGVVSYVATPTSTDSSIDILASLPPLLEVGVSLSPPPLSELPPDPPIAPPPTAPPPPLPSAPPTAPPPPLPTSAPPTAPPPPLPSAPPTSPPPPLPTSAPPTSPPPPLPSAPPTSPPPPLPSLSEIQSLTPNDDDIIPIAAVSPPPPVSTSPTEPVPPVHVQAPPPIPRRTVHSLPPPPPPPITKDDYPQEEVVMVTSPISDSSTTLGSETPDSVATPTQRLRIVQSPFVKDDDEINISLSPQPGHTPLSRTPQSEDEEYLDMELDDPLAPPPLSPPTSELYEPIEAPSEVGVVNNEVGVVNNDIKSIPPLPPRTVQAPPTLPPPPLPTSDETLDEYEPFDTQGGVATGPHPPGPDTYEPMEPESLETTPPLTPGDTYEPFDEPPPTLHQATPSFDQPPPTLPPRISKVPDLPPPPLPPPVAPPTTPPLQSDNTYESIDTKRPTEAPPTLPLRPVSGAPPPSIPIADSTYEAIDPKPYDKDANVGVVSTAPPSLPPRSIVIPPTTVLAPPTTVVTPPPDSEYEAIDFSKPLEQGLKKGAPPPPLPVRSASTQLSGTSRLSTVHEVSGNEGGVAQVGVASGNLTYEVVDTDTPRRYPGPVVQPTVSLINVFIIN